MTQTTRSINTTTSATSLQVLDANEKRIAFTITALGQITTINKGIDAAVANAGIVIQPNAVYFESNSEGFTCWKGAIQVVAAGAGSVAISETVEV